MFIAENFHNLGYVTKIVLRSSLLIYLLISITGTPSQSTWCLLFATPPLSRVITSSTSSHPLAWRLRSSTLTSSTRLLMNTWIVSSEWSTAARQQCKQIGFEFSWCFPCDRSCRISNCLFPSQNKSGRVQSILEPLHCTSNTNSNSHLPILVVLISCRACYNG